MDRSRVVELLGRWVKAAAPEEGTTWLAEKREQIAGGGPPRHFYAAFSAAPRYVGKAPLALSADELEAADRARSGWQPAGWSVDEAARTLLVLSLPDAEGEAYLDVLDRVFTHADLGESVALYQALPLLPHPERHRARAAEGIRSNMTPVFEAVALDNPYPAEQLDEGAWNQVVLKAVFVGSPLHRIQGLDRRANAELARMLVDYAHERWSAGRAVTPELWRPVGPFVEEAGAFDELERVLAEGADAEREAAALALLASDSARDSARAEEILAAHPALQEAADAGTLSWKRIGQEEAARRAEAEG